MRIPHLFAAGVLLAATGATPAAAQPEAETARLWSYAGPTGPDFWAGLGFPACAGPRQSPIDLPGEPWGFRGVVVHSPPSPGRLVNDGHTVILQLLQPNLQLLAVAETMFVFREMHLHVPAEHTVQGHRHDAEIHTVYQLGEGDRAVLTTFVDEGSPNPAWNTVIDSLPGNKGDTIPIGRVYLPTLLALDSVSAERMYSYPGSLTTPGCTPNVRFLVRETQITLSRDQLDELASAMPRNVRPVQPSPAPSAGPP